MARARRCARSHMSCSSGYSSIPFSKHAELPILPNNPYVECTAASLSVFFKDVSFVVVVVVVVVVVFAVDFFLNITPFVVWLYFCSEKEADGGGGGVPAPLNIDSDDKDSTVWVGVNFEKEEEEEDIDATMFDGNNSRVFSTEKADDTEA